MQKQIHRLDKIPPYSLRHLLGEQYEEWMPLYTGGLPSLNGIVTLDEVREFVEQALWDIRLTLFERHHVSIAEVFVKWWREKNPDTPSQDAPLQYIKEVYTLAMVHWLSGEWKSISAGELDFKWFEHHSMDFANRQVGRDIKLSGDKDGEKALRAIVAQADEIYLRTMSEEEKQDG